MKKKKIYWERLSRDVLRNVVRELLVREYTRGAIGDILGTTKDAIVGMQHRDLSEFTGISGTRRPVPPRVLAEVLKLVIHGEKPKTPVTTSLQTGSIRPKLAASEATQCEHEYGDGGRCGYEALPGTAPKKCLLHNK